MNQKGKKLPSSGLCYCNTRFPKLSVSYMLPRGHVCINDDQCTRDKSFLYRSKWTDIINSWCRISCAWSLLDHIRLYLNCKHDNLRRTPEASILCVLLLNVRFILRLRFSAYKCWQLLLQHLPQLTQAQQQMQHESDTSYQSSVRSRCC